MHILVTNDDGPPSADSSPYVLPFVHHLLAAGHKVSIVLPSEQRSWIAKAHIVGQDVRATPYTPPEYTFPGSSSPASDGDAKWFLTTSPPASCAQLALHHLFPPTGQRGPVDLVVSGPNYGRNTTAVFALSSGTMGGALEACVAGHKAIALSFAFMDRLNLPEVVAGACRHAVKVVEHLAVADGWRTGNPAGVVYSVNVPLVKGVEELKTVWTQMLLNRWKSSCFVEAEGDEKPGQAEREIREGETGQGHEDEGRRESTDGNGSVERHFKWSPKFTDVFESVKRAGPGSDGWAVANGMTSVTMLRANFMHVAGTTSGELKL
ncbi:sure-like protein [Myriangium duriaei CBS 260.36]|uniref:Sure-like protein n=1 Tax=Myriangium duriaei CBS 260.36 TaxID=1168546 RepID=A0A9P4J7P8_9PEZI|nr:sure-like protein [Myriangium duriaei CBS 260.36]